MDFVASPAVRRRLVARAHAAGRSWLERLAERRVDRDLAERWLPGLEAWWEGRGDGLAPGVERFAGEVSS